MVNQRRPPHAARPIGQAGKRPPRPYRRRLNDEPAATANRLQATASAHRPSGMRHGRAFGSGTWRGSEGMKDRLSDLVR